MSSRVEKLLDKIRNSTKERDQLSQSLQAASRIHNKRMQALELFRPFPYQDEFLFCDSTEILIQGGTRSGKSTIIAAAIASYVENKPIYTSAGIPINMREPRFADKKNGEIWIIGKQMNHSATIYRLLFQAGAFQIVRDPVTQAWRAWQPGAVPGDDKIPEVDRKQAPPFIYPGDVLFGWEKQREKQWNTANLPNGWTLKYFPSNGQPKRGDPVHRVWIDEDIESNELYDELQSRLSDFAGKIWWSSWPDLTCPPLVALYDRAVTEMDDFKAKRISHCDVYRMQFRGSDNPIIDEAEKLKRRRGWDEATRRARDDGEFCRESILSYPEFREDYHTVDYGPEHPLNDKLTMTLRANNYIPPANWCVYLILDPGTIRPFLLWVAIPPEEFWYQGKPYYVPYRELSGRLDGNQLAYRIKQIEPRRVYQRFIGDAKAGDQTPMGASHEVFENYSGPFREYGLRSVETQDKFHRGEQVWIVRSMALRRTMQSIGEGAERPQLRIVRHMCPQLIQQLKRNIRHVAKQDVQDQQAKGQVKDGLDCLEYFAGSRPEYKIPPPAPAEETAGFKAWKQEASFWEELTGGGRSPKNKAVVCGIP